MMESREAIVIVNNLSKSFRLPHEQYTGLKQMLVSLVNGGKRGYETQQVLHNVSFEIKKGEFFGIVGRNGSGKSTLLKLLAGIYVPDKGEIQLNGDITPFIELGVGFNPELTGRENVYLNGALLGFSHDDMDKMYDEIVSFAELEKSMDQKLKNYSSGMQVRLAFSIAIQAKTDILLLDEVLAVGDADFQKKCLAVFRKLKEQGRTIILVTHDMGNVEKFCDRVLIIDKGMTASVTTPSDAATTYARLNINDRKSIVQHANRWGSGEISIKKLSINSTKSGPAILDFGDSFKFSIELERQKGFEKVPVLIGLAFINQDNITVTGPNTRDVILNPESNKITYTIDKLPFQPGEYSVTVALFNNETEEAFDFYDKAINFHIISDKPSQGVVAIEGKWQTI